jgi:hypothetical protein
VNVFLTVLSMLTTGTSGKFTSAGIVDTASDAGVIVTVGRFPSASPRSMQMPRVVSMPPVVYLSLGISSRTFEKIEITEQEEVKKSRDTVP